MRTLRLLPVFALMAVLFVTCTNDATAPEPGYSTVSGVVTDAFLGVPIAGVTVTGENNQTTTTANDGSFYLKFKVDSLGSATLTFSKQGYRDTLVVASLVVLRTTTISVYMISKIPYGPASIRGALKNPLLGDVAIPGITITASGSSMSQQVVVSDTTGRFTVNIPVDSTVGNAPFSVDLIMHDTRGRFNDTTITVLATFGQITNVLARLTSKAALFATLGGVVQDGLTGNPVAGALVTSTVISPNAQTARTFTTNVLGEYTFTFQVDTASIVHMVIQNIGDADTSFYVKAIPGASTAISPVTLHGGVSHGGQGGSGLAQTIAFLGILPPEISVSGVGGTETAVLQWEVRDSLGFPIDAAHATLLTFTILSGPGGNEYISPSSLLTNSVGRASITFNSGTVSGVTQIQASAFVNRQITSAPVRVVIDGGYADQAHFTIAPTQHNLPLALNRMNDLWAVNVLIGDRYSNPAATSAVYFRSTAGVVEGTNGSAATSKDGQVTVNLITGHPFADEAVARIPGMDPGFAWIHAQTVGERGAIVQDSTLVLCTGLGTISNVSPAFLDVPDSGSAVVSFKVSDLYNHPLASGTTISVVATLPPPSYPDAPQNKVLVSFGTEGTITLGDMMVGGTDFTARVSDGSWEIHQGTPFYLSITVKGPNTNNLPITQEIDGMVH